MRRLFLTLLTAIFLSSNFLSIVDAEEYPIDIEVEKCCEKNFSTTGMNNCTLKGLENWHNEIKYYSDKVKKYLDAEQQEMFEASQNAWQTYYDKEKELQKSTVLLKDGDIHTTFVLGYLYDLTKQRAIMIKSYFNSLSE